MLFKRGLMFAGRSKEQKLLERRIWRKAHINGLFSFMARSTAKGEEKVVWNGCGHRGGRNI